MAITTIPWNDGSGDNIYVSAPSQTGSQTVEVTSDANTGSARTKTVTFTASGLSPVTLTVNQEAGGPQEYTITVNPSSYDTDNSVLQYWFSGGAASNAYTPSTSTTAAKAILTFGTEAETKIYWKFNLSSIPVGATILSVSMVVKSRMSNAGDAFTSARYNVVCEGTTAVGTPSSSLTRTATTYTLDCGSGWTRDKLQDISVLSYAKRTSTSTSSLYYLEFHGADLTVVYSA